MSDDPYAFQASLDVLNPTKTPDATVEARLAAATAIRKTLSAEDGQQDPIIEDILERGGLAILKPLLSDDNPMIIREAAWALANVASSSDPAHCRAMTEGPHSVHGELTALLRHPSAEVVEQAAWGLGNIAGEGAAYRDLLLRSGIASALCASFEGASPSFRNTLAWVLSNLCRAKPPPAPEHLTPIFMLFSAVLSGINSADVDANAEWLTEVLWAVSFMSDGDNSCIARCLEYGLLRHALRLFRDEQAAPGVGEGAGVAGPRRVAAEHLGAALAFLPTNDLRRLCCASRDVYLASLCDNDEAYNRLRSSFLISTRAFRSPIIRIIGNVASGSDRQTSEALANGATGLLEELLRCEDIKEGEFKELLWTLSNIAAGPPVHALTVAENRLFVDAVARGLRHTRAVVAREAAYILPNLHAALGDSYFVKNLRAAEDLLLPAIAAHLDFHICGGGGPTMSCFDPFVRSRGHSGLATLTAMFVDERRVQRMLEGRGFEVGPSAESWKMLDPITGEGFARLSEEARPYFDAVVDSLVLTKSPFKRRGDIENTIAALRRYRTYLVAAAAKSTAEFDKDNEAADELPLGTPSGPEFAELLFRLHWQPMMAILDMQGYVGTHQAKDSDEWEVVEGEDGEEATEQEDGFFILRTPAGNSRVEEANGEKSADTDGDEENNERRSVVVAEDGEGERRHIHQSRRE